jgi:hypothetical protein
MVTARHRSSGKQRKMGYRIAFFRTRNYGRTGDNYLTEYIFSLEHALSIVWLLRREKP